MPTYEYACSKCQNQWEEVQRITEPPTVVCPKCKKKSAQRQISGGNFILKGGGWYADAYSSPKAKADANGAGKSEGTSESAGKSEGKSAGKGESRAESKSEAKSEKKESVAPAAPSGSGPRSKS
jgi:putative FmdB family regulatory protein